MDFAYNQAKLHKKILRKGRVRWARMVQRAGSGENLPIPTDRMDLGVAGQTFKQVACAGAATVIWATGIAIFRRTQNE